MGTVVCFGEVMLRLSPPGYLRMSQTDSLSMTFGGAEANVSVSLANYGMQARYVTRLPDNPITEVFEQQMRSFGVDTRFIVKGGDRMGIYFVEKGASMRPSKVIYDRKYSASSTAKPGVERKRSSRSWKSSMRSAFSSSRMVKVASFSSAPEKGSSTPILTASAKTMF